MGDAKQSCSQKHTRETHTHKRKKDLALGYDRPVILSRGGPLRRHLSAVGLMSRCRRISAREARHDELVLVHTAEHVRVVQVWRSMCIPRILVPMGVPLPRLTALQSSATLKRPLSCHLSAPLWNAQNIAATVVPASFS